MSNRYCLSKFNSSNSSLENTCCRVSVSEINLSCRPIAMNAVMGNRHSSNVRGSRTFWGAPALQLKCSRAKIPAVSPASRTSAGEYSENKSGVKQSSPQIRLWRSSRSNNRSSDKAQSRISSGIRGISTLCRTYSIPLNSQEHVFTVRHSSNARLRSRVLFRFMLSSSVYRLRMVSPQP